MPDKAFHLWAVQHKKSYADSKEHDERYGIWRKAVSTIRKLQQENPSVEFALTEFADMTYDEFKQRLGLRMDLAQPNNLASRSFRYANSEVPASIDWREKGAVTEVKNQGGCGSCWAFSTTGSVEGINAIKTGKLVSLSEQELVDCDSEKDMGCGGGLMNNAFEYILKNGGLDTEEDYGYWSSWGMSFWTCNKRKEHDRHVVTIDGYEQVPPDEDSLKKAAAHQPVSVAICASESMMYYKSGVIDKCCDGLNHGVLLVGYGTDAKTGADYWIVKNSWGDGWGEKGFFRLKMHGAANPGGLCGIATVASYPTKDHPNPVVPFMCDMFGWTECPASSTCSCSFSFFGMFCLWHDCCPLEGGVTCSDLRHCCPANTVCDEQNAMCVSEDGKTSVKWTDKVKANVQGKQPGSTMSMLPRNPLLSMPKEVTPEHDGKFKHTQRIQPQ